jgi:hypothetical protein
VPRGQRSRPRATEAGPAKINASPQDKPVEVVLAGLSRVRRTARGWSAACPGPNHRRGDKHPSLSISQGSDGCVLLRCHVGCRVEDVLRPMGLELVDLFPARARSGHLQRRLERPEPSFRIPRSAARDWAG